MIKWLEKNRKFAIALTVLIAIEIFYFSSIPGSAFGTEGNIWISRAYHFIVFFLLSFFLFLSIKSNEKITAKQIVLVLAFSAVYAITDEIHQLFTPFRSCTFVDVMTDLSGASFAVFLHLLTNKKSIR